ncbi:hypothetical protein [Actinophytocola sp. NPDC049390]|uniref:hypothetical protein n=1 Tax=Actinophytocola sp. NPDC049390 TaxID=3363894 RepID=UPI0037BB9EAF
MTWQPDLADDEVLRRRHTLAANVRDDLSAAGLPIVAESATLGTGVLVEVDPLDDESGGVIVDWTTHFMLRSAATDALSAGHRDHPAIRYSGTVSKIMHDAVADILETAGYTLLRDYNDMSPYTILVTGQERGPSWRDWLHEQTNRQEQALHETTQNEQAKP